MTQENANKTRDDLEVVLIRTLSGVLFESQRVQHAFAQENELHDTDFRALTAIYAAEGKGKPFTSAALGRYLMITPAAVTYLVDRLEKSGHVVRGRDESDRRRVELHYSDYGHEVATNFVKPLRARINDSLQKFTDEELEIASHVLVALRTALEPDVERP